VTEAETTPVEGQDPLAEQARADTAPPADPWPPGHDAVSIVDDPAALHADLEAIASERDSHLADLQRITAEFANFRRQATKRQTDVIEHAASGLAEKLLPVLDACDSAVAQGAVDIEPILNALLEVLQREGLEMVSESPAAFDPERHEAVIHDPGEGSGGDPEVCEIMRTGYVWRGRVLRPAMVRVRG
jgi:molecular chaperone GrpE